MLFIANYWQNGSGTTVKVYSNCNEIELLLNGKSVGRHHPDKDQYSTNLKHPPFTFHIPAFKPGTLTAIGYINNKKIIEQQRKTPGDAIKINLRADYSGQGLKAGQNDIVFVYADIMDKDGTIVYDAANPIEFKVTGDAEIIGQNPRMAEAGTASRIMDLRKRSVSW